APDGIVSIEIDPQTGMPATPMCPTSRMEVYIAGTQPVGSCPLHSGGGRTPTHITGWGPAAPPAPAPPPEITPRTPTAGGDSQFALPATIQRAARQTPPDPAPKSPEPKKEGDQEKKKGILRRFLGVFK